MMNGIIERHHIADDLHIYKQGNSSKWYARFKLGGKWMSRATGKREQPDAINRAIAIKAECDTMLRHGIAVQTKAFKDVAALAIEEMRRVPAGAKGAASMADYEQVLNKYHVPFFDRTFITSIDYEKLGKFDEWRKTTMGRTPAQSTLKTHNAALQRVFDLAVARGWMSKSRVPELTVTQGVAAQRRSHFTHAEVTEILSAFPAWIAESRKRITRDVRKLLYYYVQIALNTGMRPGKELDQLTWGHVDDTPADHVVFKVQKGKTTLYTGTRC